MLSKKNSLSEWKGWIIICYSKFVGCWSYNQAIDMKTVNFFLTKSKIDYFKRRSKYLSAKYIGFYYKK